MVFGVGHGTVEKQSLAAAICFLEVLSYRHEKKSAIDLCFVSMYCSSQNFLHSFEAMATETRSYHIIFICLDPSWPVFPSQNFLSRLRMASPPIITWLRAYVIPQS